MRTDVGNAYNSARHREMWAVLHNPEAPILAALQMDAAAVVVNLYMIPDEPGIFRQCVENIGRLRHACDQYAMPLMIEPLVMSPAGGAPPTARSATWRRSCRWCGWRASWAPTSSRPTRPNGWQTSTAWWKRRAARRWCAAAARGAGAGAGEIRRADGRGASGMVYGRNVYQHSNPSQVVRALMAIIHQGASGQQALEIYHQQ